jgi:hypothetical protein
MPDQQNIGGQSTAPIVAVAGSLAVASLNRPRQHNRLEPVASHPRI